MEMQLRNHIYIQHSFEEPKLQIHVPSFVMLKVEQPPDVEKHSLQKGMLGKQYSVWFCLKKKNSANKVKLLLKTPN